MGSVVYDTKIYYQGIVHHGTHGQRSVGPTVQVRSAQLIIHRPFSKKHSSFHPMFLSQFFIKFVTEFTRIIFGIH